jgi:gas vesicle protein
MSDETGFFEGLLLGLVVGAMLSLLTAPEKGKKLRSYIYQTFEEMLESIDEEVKKYRTEVS